MTLVSDIIRDAYRESDLLAISADPTAYEMDEGLRLLNRLVSSAYGNEMGEQLDPLPLGRNNINRPQGYPWYDQVPDWQDWFVPPNCRTVLNLTAPLTVYLDPNPEDGTRFAIQDMSGNLSTYPFTVSANGRLIEGAEIKVYNTDSIASEFFYRQDTGNWAKVTPLDLADTFPFPIDFDDYFVIGLSFRLNPRHAVEADPQSVQAYNRSGTQFKARYRQHSFVWSDLALIRTPGSKKRYYDNTRYGNSLFNSGWAYPWGGYLY